MKNKTLTKDKGIKIDREKATLTVKHFGRDLSFVFEESLLTNDEIREIHGFYGWNKVHPIDHQERLKSQGLDCPTASQTASLIYSVWKTALLDDFTGYSGYCAERIIKQLQYGFIQFNSIFYVKSKGVYIEDQPKLVERVGDDSQSEILATLDHDELERRLDHGREESGVTFSKDGTVRFVPFGYKTGVQTYSELARHPLMIALYEKEGAEKIAWVASRYLKRPIIYAPKEIDYQKFAFSTLSAGWPGNNRLSIVCNEFPENCRGAALGVLRGNKNKKEREK